MSKRDWTLIMAAFGILAVLWAIGGFIVADQQDQLERNQQRLENLTVNVTASLCLQAFAAEGQEAELVRRFVADRPIPLRNRTCRRAVLLAKAQIEGEAP